MASVTLRNICKSYDEVQVTRDVNLDIQDGEFVVFVGPSGCGKSTLLRMIAGLEDITSGDMYIGNDRVNNLPPKEREVGMVFQSYALYPHMDVAENMAFGLKLAKTNKTEINRRVQDAANLLQLDKLLERKPKDLSGGQRQRVAIGRTIVREPEVFLFDEPLSNLDASLRVQMRIEISRLHKRLGATMVYVTHDQVEAMTMADKIVALDNGTIAQVGKPMELYHYPATRFVAGFIGSPKMNFIDCTVVSASSQSATIVMPGDHRLELPVNGAELSEGETVTLGIRPEHLSEDQEADMYLQGEVHVVERLGYQTLVHLDVNNVEGVITMRTDGSNPIQEGARMTLGMNANKCHLFRQDGTTCPRLYREPCIDF
ncbi:MULTISPECIES: maltose/maltodextrin ABC transporter ATP-binding protein MalK [unclassified Marinobacter]|uniref:maltose/maltodextrin ABC transporter ATP-binding protein MalK n=1 Tax=unclassified Marinobacter TaxID=83889 RepID=UPI0019255AC5|nr:MULTISPECIES: maltose/maltodextrin ABC transporter ATP-binding protein MalK [unclassified Marinobacter]MBL3825340.1 maltose/maltodextrin ABC transporter ATP-binding protein MalK [Marinobacter sp. MC3]MBL3893846.1 maltose/maltodextrin ABC transporter ATP-binding protein MalK [Marinobacter sp. MW3]